MQIYVISLKSVNNLMLRIQCRFQIKNIDFDYFKILFVCSCDDFKFKFLVVTMKMFPIWK